MTGWAPAGRVGGTTGRPVGDFTTPCGRGPGGGVGWGRARIRPVTTYATLHTNKGDIRIQLFPDHAPKTVRNFVGLADGSQEWTDPRTGEKKSTPLYDGVVFHRVI